MKIFDRAIGQLIKRLRNLIYIASRIAAVFLAKKKDIIRKGNSMGEMGKYLMIIGVILIIAGFFFYVGEKLLPLGRLPGDILIKKGNFTIFLPLASSILLSIILTLLLNFIFRR